MRPFLCWNCGNLSKCNKEFPNGRPKRRSECSDFTDAPKEPTRITHQEIANAVGCTLKKLESIIASASGLRYVTKTLARKGIVLTYERINNRILFYREDKNK